MFISTSLLTSTRTIINLSITDIAFTTCTFMHLLHSSWTVGLVSFTEGAHVDSAVPEQILEAVHRGLVDLGLAGQDPRGLNVGDPQRQTTTGIHQGIVVVVRLDHPVGAVGRSYEQTSCQITERVHGIVYQQRVGNSAVRTSLPCFSVPFFYFHCFI